MERISCKNVNISMPIGTHIRLKVAAARLQCSMGQVITTLLDRCHPMAVEQEAAMIRHEQAMQEADALEKEVRK